MKELVRFGISINDRLLKRFDTLISEKGYVNRSEAIRDLIRNSLIEEDIETNASVIGVLNLLYDHHKRDLQDGLTHFQHDYHEKFISSTHVHLDHNNCLEVILLRGRAGEIKSLADQMIALKGIKHGQIYLTSTGEDLS